MIAIPYNRALKNPPRRPQCVSHRKLSPSTTSYLVPARSEVLPNEAILKTRLTRNIELNIPLISAAMDTVTEAKLAISMAQEGGIGIVHKNLSVESQARAGCKG